MCWMLVDRIDGDSGRRVLVWLNCLPKQQHNIQGEWMSCVFSFWWRRERWWKGNEIHLRLFGAMLSGFLVLFENFVFLLFHFLNSFYHHHDGIFSMFLQRFFFLCISVLAHITNMFIWCVSVFFSLFDDDEQLFFSVF